MRKVLSAVMLAALLLAVLPSVCGCIYFGPERPEVTVTEAPAETEAPSAAPSPTTAPTETPEIFTFINRTNEFIMLYIIRNGSNWGAPVTQLMRGASSEIGFDEIDGLPGRNYNVGVVTAGEHSRSYVFCMVVIAADNTVELIEEEGFYYVVVHRADGAVQRYKAEYVYD